MPILIALIFFKIGLKLSPVLPKKVRNFLALGPLPQDPYNDPLF